MVVAILPGTGCDGNCRPGGANAAKAAWISWLPKLTGALAGALATVKRMALLPRGSPRAIPSAPAPRTTDEPAGGAPPTTEGQAPGSSRSLNHARRRPAGRYAHC